MRSLLSEGPCHGLADEGGGFGDGDSGGEECVYLFLSGSLSAGDDGAGMPHSFSFWCGLTANETDNRFGHVVLSEFREIFHLLYGRCRPRL